MGPSRPRPTVTTVRHVVRGGWVYGTTQKAVGGQGSGDPTHRVRQPPPVCCMPRPARRHTVSPGTEVPFGPTSDPSTSNRSVV